MGCDIHTVAQKRDADGKWICVKGEFQEGSDPFDWRQYGMYGWLADVRNHSGVTPISQPRDLPHDHDLEGWDGEYWLTPDREYGDGWLGEHSRSWLSVEELLAVDYEQIVEDRRVSRQISANIWSGAETAEPGGGEKMTLRKFLGEAYFSDLAELRRIGAERILFGFDS